MAVQPAWGCRRKGRQLSLQEATIVLLGSCNPLPSVAPATGCPLVHRLTSFLGSMPASKRQWGWSGVFVSSAPGSAGFPWPSVACSLFRGSVVCPGLCPQPSFHFQPHAPQLRPSCSVWSGVCPFCVSCTVCPVIRQTPKVVNLSQLLWV